MRSRSLLVAAILIAGARTVAADGALSVRSVYYKEKSTRVIQPMLDGMFDVGTRGLLSAHFLVDAITSASPGSGAAATPFTEKRYEGGANYVHAATRTTRLKVDSRYSNEPDYKSLYGGLGFEQDLAHKNATIGLSGGVGHDHVDNSGAQGPFSTLVQGELNTYSLFASASQILSPNAIVGVSYDLASLHGFQQNPYRTVITDDGLVAEKHPDERLRQAIAISARYYVPSTRTTLIGAYRYYHDDWKVDAHTPELRVVQQAGDDVDFAVRYRYYTQTKAYFYEDHYASSVPAMNPYPYFSDDPKLTAFTGQTMEAKLGVLGEAFTLGGRWAGARFEGILAYVIQHNRFGNAAIAQFALTVPFDY
jgi:hypothetical protein